MIEIFSPDLVSWKIPRNGVIDNSSDYREKKTRQYDVSFKFFPIQTRFLRQYHCGDMYQIQESKNLSVS